MALLSVALFYALNYFILKRTFEDIPPLAIWVIRAFFGAVLFTGLSYLVGTEPIRSRADYWRLFACGITGVSLNQWLFLNGLAQTSEVNASVLMITAPVFVFLFAFLAQAESVSWLRIAGLLLSFAGAAMISLGDRSLSISSTTVSGDLMILGNAACYGLYLVLVRPLLLRYHVFTITKWVFGFGAIMVVPLGIASLWAVSWSEVSSFAWFGAAYVVLFVTVLAYGLNAWAMQRVPSSYVGIYIYLQPVLVAIIAGVLLGQVIEMEKFSYIFAVFAGVFLVTYKKIQRNN